MGEDFSFKTQSIGLEGVANARELGGYPMNDGRRVRRGRFFRTGALATATDNDIRKLEAFSLRHVFDFRTGYEADKAPDLPVPGADRFSLPSVDPVDDVWKETPLAKATKDIFVDELLRFSFTDEAKAIARNMYPSLILSEYTQLQYATFLNYAVNTPEGAILWHCSQGKDRTGIGAAFLLSALGASRELLIADFDLSNVFYRQQTDDLIAQLTTMGGGEEEFEVIRSFIGVNTKNFISALNLIDHEFGSMQKYLTEYLCISEEEMEKFRSHALE